MIASYKGLQVSGGAEGVGRRSTSPSSPAWSRSAMVSVVYTQLFLAFYPEVNFGG